MQAVSCIVPAQCSLPCALKMQQSIGRAVRARRLELDWSQSELARRSGTHRLIVGRVERGLHKPSLDTLIRYAQALGCSVSDLALEAEGQLAPEVRS
jgi:transcriptional regulator with XRE-family HTH domain